MKLGRKLRWDPIKEVFAGDDEANAMLARPQRTPYGINRLLKKSMKPSLRPLEVAPPPLRL